jgi:hypothetical protein
MWSINKQRKPWLAFCQRIIKKGCRCADNFLLTLAFSFEFANLPTNEKQSRGQKKKC